MWLIGIFLWSTDIVPVHFAMPCCVCSRNLPCCPGIVVTDYALDYMSILEICHAIFFPFVNAYCQCLMCCVVGEFTPFLPCSHYIVNLVFPWNNMGVTQVFQCSPIWWCNVDLPWLLYVCDGDFLRAFITYLVLYFCHRAFVCTTYFWHALF